MGTAQLKSPGGSGGSSFLNITENDFTQTDYYYYGGTDSSDVFKINRYDLTDLTNRTQATGAWVDRYSLTYT